MGTKESALKTSMTVSQCGELFKRASRDARGFGSKVGGLAAKVRGRDQSGFFTPTSDSPFDALDGDKPAFSVGVLIPRMLNGGDGAVTAVHMYVWDRGDAREERLVSPHGITGGMHASSVLERVTAAFRAADRHATGIA